MEFQDQEDVKKMISSAFFKTMVDALKLTHGSHVDLITVVASVGPVPRDLQLTPSSLGRYVSWIPGLNIYFGSIYAKY